MQITYQILNYEAYDLLVQVMFTLMDLAKTIQPCSLLQLKSIINYLTLTLIYFTNMTPNGLLVADLVHIVSIIK